MEQLANETAVVIGGGQGIGRGVALALADERMHVAVLDIEADAAARTAKELEARGVRALALPVDVTDEHALAAAASEVTARLGPVRLLSNHAGVSAPQGPITDKSDADWQWVFSVNLFGIVKAVQAFLPGMRAHGRGGHIVNTSSMAGLVSVPALQVGVYTASKYACTAYCEILRAELAPENIGVSVLCPGLIDTELSFTSARNRPARFGGPLPTPAPMPAAMRQTAMQPEDVGPIVVRGIKANRLHILTHPEMSVPLAEARFAAIRADAEGEVRDRASAIATHPA
ncbi:MAG: SDR family NAD(P)-dependent oxidoreductase [Myxococcota bacterium]